MLSDRELEYLTQAIQDIYSQIEVELIISICKRLKTYNSIDGTLNWQLKKLSELKVLNKDLLKIFAKYTGKTEEAIRRMFEKARLGNIDKDYLQEAYEAGETTITYENLKNSPVLQRLVDNSVYELRDRLSLINTKALESARDGYIRSLERSYVEVMTGTYGLDEAIQKNVKDMAKKGFIGASYESGRKISLEAAVRRDTRSAVGHEVNEGALQSAELMGTNYVQVSEHLGARTSKTSKIANHAGWQGKVYQIEGSSPEYGNLIEETGYGQIEGLGGVNCRHRMFPYFPGISVKKHESVDSKRSEEVFKASQKQRALEREWRATKREAAAAKAIGADQSYKDCRKRCLEISDEIEKLRKKFPELSGSGNRVLTWEEITG